MVINRAERGYLANKAISCKRIENTSKRVEDAIFIANNNEAHKLGFLKPNVRRIC